MYDLPCLFCRFANRLTGIKENNKFQKKGLKHVVEEAKKQHSVK